MSKETTAILPRPSPSRTRKTPPPEASYSESQLIPLLTALQAAKAGDFSVRLPDQPEGVLSDIYRAFNEVIAMNESEAQEIVRVARLVGREGRMTERAGLEGA